MEEQDYKRKMGEEQDRNVAERNNLHHNSKYNLTFSKMIMKRDKITNLEDKTGDEMSKLPNEWLRGDKGTSRSH